MILDDDSVRLLSHELAGLDYSLLYQAYLYEKCAVETKPGYNIKIAVDGEYIVVEMEKAELQKRYQQMGKYGI